MRIDSLGTPATAEVQDRKLTAGAHEFEAMLVSEMMKPLHFGETEDEGDGELTGAAGTIHSMATEALSKGIAAGGGLGIAREILRQVTAEREAHGAAGPGTKV